MFCSTQEFPERLSPSCACVDPALPSPSARLCAPHGSFSSTPRAKAKEKLQEMASPPVFWPGLKAKSGQQLFTGPLEPEIQRGRWRTALGYITQSGRSRFRKSKGSWSYIIQIQNASTYLLVNASGCKTECFMVCFKVINKKI